MNKYPRIFKAMCSVPWAIQPEKLEAIVEFMMLKMAGTQFTPAEIEARTGAMARSSRGSQGGGSVAVIPVHGIIAHRVSLMNDISGGGGFAIESFRAQFGSALNNPEVDTIVLDIDSPGGSTDNVAEISDEIFRARGQKRIIAVANSLAASAAYWMATAADELVVTPSGQVGSVGVYMMHSDYSEAYAQKGIKNTFISAGRYKVEANPYEPLGDEASAALQDVVDAYYDMFTKAVARHRGVSVSDVRNGFGQGRTVMAKEAVRLGMADRVASLEEVLSKLGVRTSDSRQSLRVEACTHDVAGGVVSDKEIVAAVNLPQTETDTPLESPSKDDAARHKREKALRLLQI